MDSELKYQVHTFGCKVNTYDAGLVQKNMNARGFVPVQGKTETSRIHVLNTCAVTAEATKEAQRYVRRLKAKDPFCTVVVTGCAAQVDTQKFTSLPGVDLVVANSHKGQLPELLRQFYAGTLKEKIFKSNIFRKEDLEAGGGLEKEHTRAFLKIQDGCNSFCSYCIIPFARGKSRSIPVVELVRRVNELHQNTGVGEVVLTGVHIGDYEDQNLKLEDLLEQILLKTQVPRFRLTSLEPVEISERLLDLYQDSRLCPHFHMSIQSAESQVLRDMKRNYSQKEVRESLLRISERVPQAFVGMDVIVGFPTEGELEFSETLKVLKETPWSRLHVFPYSERPGTKAATLLDSVPWECRLQRAAQVRELSAQRLLKMAEQQIHKIKDVLILNKPARGSQGLSRDYWPVRIEGAEAFLPHWRGKEISVRITGMDRSVTANQDVCLIGEIYE